MQIFSEVCENIVYRSTDAGADLDMDNFEGETSLTMDRTGGTADVDNLELATSLTLKDLRATADSTFNYLDADVTGSADAGAVTVDGVQDGADVPILGDELSVTAVGMPVV